MLEVHYHPRPPAYLHISSNIEWERGFPSLSSLPYQTTVPHLSLKGKGQEDTTEPMAYIKHSKWIHLPIYMLEM